MSADELQKNPQATVLIGAMTLGYMAMIATMYVRVSSMQGLRFWRSIGWRWPGGRWYGYVLFGSIMALGLPLLSKVVPFPKSVPMDRLFQDARAAYLILIMGIAIAPLAEELSFRGFLYPLLDRWLQTAFMVRKQLLNGSKWLILIAAWGFVIRGLAFSTGLTLEPKLKLAISLLVVLLGFLLVGVIVFVRLLSGKALQTTLLCGLALCFWGLLCRSASDLSFKSVTSTLLALAVVSAATAALGALPAAVAAWLGRSLAVLGTGIAFTTVHAEQLGGAWGPLLIIFIVGLVLTIVRTVTRSLAPSFLIHLGYNFTLFATLYIGSDHFRHLERLTQQ